VEPVGVQTLKCPACGSFFRSEDLDTARGVLTCRYCRALTLFRAPPSATPGFVARPEVPLPQRVTLEDTLGGGIVIRRRWFQGSFVFLAVFCTIWFGFLAVWYTVTLKSGAPILFSLFPVVHVVVGLFLGYFTLAGFLNTTTIAAGDEKLAVRHGPIPWRGVPELAASRITQLYCKERIHRGKNSSTTSYEVWAALDEGQPRKLVSRLSEPEQALFIEQRIEKALGLADRPMPAELPR